MIHKNKKQKYLKSCLNARSIIKVKKTKKFDSVHLKNLLQINRINFLECLTFF